MKSGMLIIFHNFESRKSDAQTYRDCVALAEAAEPLGFDFLMATEHHFTDYSMCPDNLDFLCFMAAKTSRIKLGPGAIPQHASATLSLSQADAEPMRQGELDPLAAFMSGRIRVEGDMTLVLQMQAIQMQAAMQAGRR